MARSSRAVLVPFVALVVACHAPTEVPSLVLSTGGGASAASPAPASSAPAC